MAFLAGARLGARCLARGLGIVGAALALGACGAAPETVQRQDLVMDTTVALTINGRAAAAAADAILTRLHEIDARVRAQAADSEVAAVNAAAGGGPVKVSADTQAIAGIALELSRLTGGVFDPTIGPVTSLWDIQSDNPRVPGSDELARALALVDWRAVRLDPAAGTLGLDRAGMRLDFGGVAKGYAALEAARICREAGVDSALIDLGESTIYALGVKANGKKWRVGIQDPLAAEAGEKGKLLGVLEVSGQVVQSSGTYERFFESDGVRYHHIMDPTTGRPTTNGVVQVTLVMPGDTRFADGLSTSVLILGPKKGMDLVESMPGVAAVIVTGDRTVHLSSRARELFKLDAVGFTVAESAP